MSVNIVGIFATTVARSGRRSPIFNIPPRPYSRWRLPLMFRLVLAIAITVLCTWESLRTGSSRTQDARAPLSPSPPDSSPCMDLHLISGCRIWVSPSNVSYSTLDDRNQHDSTRFFFTIWANLIRLMHFRKPMRCIPLPHIILAEIRKICVGCVIPGIIAA